MEPIEIGDDAASNFPQLPPDYVNDELLFEDSEAGISFHKAYLRSDPKSAVIIKISSPSDDHVILEDLKREYDLLQRVHSNSKNPLASSRVVVPHAYHEQDGYQMLVMNDTGGVPLSLFCNEMIVSHGLAGNGPLLPVELVLKVAEQIAEAIEVMHEAKVLHKDIHPGNIDICIRQDGHCACILTNLSIAERVEDIGAIPHSYAVGSPEYMSPEQTGRLGRVLDERSDYYSLGITMWELLVGRRPFEAEDPIDIIYSQLAKEADEPASLSSHIPHVISEIVTKLIQKEPSSRYQSTSGLKYDLRQCIERISKARESQAIPFSPYEFHHDIVADAFRDWDFVIGSRDASFTLCFGKKIYGREKEHETLSSAFKQIASGERTNALVLLEGKCGSGRSSFVTLLERDVFAARGYMVVSKCGKHESNSPFAGLISVLGQLVAFLLAESPEKLVTWQMELESELGPERLQALASLVPSLGNVVPSVAVVPLTANIRSISQVELFKSVEIFLRLFATSESPLVLVFDENAAGVGTIDAMVHLLNRSHLPHLMIVCFLTEDDPSPHVHKAISEIKRYQNKVHFLSIKLGPLSQDAVIDMLLDVIRPPLGDLDALTDLILKRTQGNPLHAVQFLKTCAAKHLLEFSFERGGWIWDIKELEEATEITDNVAEFLTSGMIDMSTDTKNVLATAAALGYVFDAGLLAEILKLEKADILNFLSPCIKDGYIAPAGSGTRRINRVYTESLASMNLLQASVSRFPSSSLMDRNGAQSTWGVFKFCHNRIHNACLNSLEPFERAEKFYIIANHFLSKSSQESLYEISLDLVRVIREAETRIEQEKDRFMAAKVYSIAANRLFRANDTEMANEYASECLQFLSRVSDQLLMSDKKEALDIYTNLLYIKASSSPQQAQELSTEAEQRLGCDDSYQWLFCKQQVAVSQNNIFETELMGLQGLEVYGIPIPTKQEELVARAIECAHEFDILLGEKSIEQLTWDLKPAPPEFYVVENALHFTISASKALGHESLTLYLVAKACVLSMRKGISLSTVEFFATACRLYSGALGFYNLPRARMLGEFVQANMLRLTSTQTATSSMSLFIGYGFNLGYQGGNDLLHRAIVSALESPYPYYAIITLNIHHILHELPYGRSLNLLKDMPAILKTQISKLDASWVNEWRFFASSIEFFSQGILVNEPDFEPLHPLSNHIPIILNAFGAVLHNLPEQCEKIAACLSIEKYYIGSWLFLDFHVWNCIANSRRLLTASGAIAVECKHSIEKSLGIIRQLSTEKCLDHSFKYYLAQAEYYRYQGNVTRASQYYEQATDQSIGSGNILYEAWALELQGGFWHENKIKIVAKTLLQNACGLWKQWGSEAKVLYIHQTYPHLNLSLPQGPKKPSPIRTGLQPMSPFPVGSSSDLNSSSNGSPDRSSPKAPFGKQVDVDVKTLLEVARSISDEHNLDELIEKIVTHLMTNSGATKALFFLNENGSLQQQFVRSRDEDDDELIAESKTDAAPNSIVNYVFRTAETLLFQETPTDMSYKRDPYIEKYSPRSILCCPIQVQSAVIGVIYLENRLQNSAFTPTGIQIVKSLMTSAAIAIENARLIKKNNELANALRETQSEQQPDRPKYRVDAPIRRVLDSIEVIKQRFDQADPAVTMLQQIVKTLTSDGLFSANVEDISDNNGKGLDQETRSWVEESLFQKAVPSTLLGSSHRRSLQVEPVQDISLSHQVTIDSTLQNSEAALTPSSQEIIDEGLKNVGQYTFDVFGLTEVSQGRPLIHLALNVLARYDLNSQFNINKATAFAFFDKVDRLYHKVPYHNSTHAADVLHTCCLLLTETPLINSFTKLEILCLIIACAVHDVDHPGVSNVFLISAAHPLALLYNDSAVLESHHASKTFELLCSPGANILSKLTAEQFKLARKMIISMVMATDLSQHFQYINKLKGKLAAGSLKLEEDTDRQLILDMAIKCGDLGNPAKELQESKKWSALIMEEFFRQGDREKEFGLPVSKFMDRNDTNIPKCQIGFIDVLVAPLYDAWSQFSSTEYTTRCMKNIASNREYWGSYLEDTSFDLSDVQVPISPANDQILSISVPSITFGQRSSSSYVSSPNYTLAPRRAPSDRRRSIQAYSVLSQESAARRYSQDSSQKSEEHIAVSSPSPIRNRFKPEPRMIG